MVELVVNVFKYLLMMSVANIFGGFWWFIQSSVISTLAKFNYIYKG